MEIISSLTEQTTAATDAILGIEAVCLALFLQRFASNNPWRVRIWQTVLLLTAFVAFAGTIAHGLVMEKATYELIWKPMLVCLGLLVAAVVLAAIYDRWGPDAARRLAPWLAGVGVGFFALVHVPGATFLFFILYEAVGMLFALAVYGALAAKRRLAGAGLITLGIVLQIVAAAAQASGPFEVRLIWPFDHNGVFHLIGMVATVVMIVGVARGLHTTSDG